MIKAILLLLKRILCRVEEPLAPPSSTQEISSGELYVILRNRFSTKGVLYLSDRRYKLCNIKDVRRFCQADRTNRMKYVEEDYDCDDFSYRLMGQFSIPGWSELAFGIMWTEKDALNCFVDEAKNLWFLDPQTDTISNDLADWQGSELRFIVM